MGGFVLIHRALIGNPKFRGRDDEYAAIWLVVHAVWRKISVRVNSRSVTLERGECCYSMRYLAEAWECSKSAAHLRLRHFEKNGFIGTAVKTGLTIITLCNYDQYQISKDDARTADGTGSGQTRDRLGTNKKERNKGNKGNEESKGDSSLVFSIQPEGQLLTNAEDGRVEVLTPPPGGHPPLIVASGRETEENPNAAGDTLSPLIAEAQAPEVVAVRMWNAMAEKAGLSQAQKISRRRRAGLERRLKDAGGLDGWEVALEKVASSPFMTGNSASGWRATLDFVLKEDNFTRLMEGNYDPGPRRSPGEGDPGGVMAALNRMEERP